MERIIESCFPYREVSDLVRREIRNPRPYQRIHPWPGRLPGVLFRALILASLLPEGAEDLFWRLLRLKNRKAGIGKGMVFLDPFAGSGTSLVEALSLGMKVVGVEVNSVAWFIARSLLTYVELAEVKRAVTTVVEEVRPLAEKLYSTSVGGTRVTAKLFFWVRTVRCEACGGVVRLFKTYKLAKVGGKVWVYCPHCRSTFLVDDTKTLKCPGCGELLEPVSTGRLYMCPECGHRGSIVRSARSMGKPGMELLAVMYCADGECTVKAAEEDDVKRYREAEKLAEKIPKGFLKLKLKFGEETSRVLSYGYRYVRELFNARQLVMLYALTKAISKLEGEARNLLALALSKAAAYSTTLTPYSYVGRKPESMFALHQYMFEKMYMEVNILEKGRGSFLNSLASVIRAKEYTRIAVGPVRLSTDLGGADAVLLLQPAQNLELPRNSIDLVVTDPPHFGNLVNSGIADFHYAILKPLLKDEFAEFRGERSCRDEDEVVFDPKRGKDEGFYRRGIARALSGVGKALKPDGLLVLVFRHREERAWSVLRSALKEAGFETIKEWPLNLENYPQPQARLGAKVRSAAVVCRKVSG